MPIGDDGLFSRIWRFIEQFDESDRIRRQDMDTAFDDLVIGVNQSLLSNPQYEDVASASAASIPAAVLRISTSTYDSDASANSGGATYARSSSSEVASYPALAWFTSADGAYWLLDERRPTVSMFGALADMTYSTVLEPDKHASLGDVGTGITGLVKDAGTDCRAAVVAGDTYARVRGVDLWFEEGGYFIDNTGDGEITTTARWLSVKDFGATLWIDYNRDGNGIHQSGLVFKSDNTGLGVPGDHGFKLIGQFSATTTKPDARGHQGTIWRTNEYYSGSAQPIIRNICVRALMCRAALERDEASVVSQRSIGSILCAAMAGVEKFWFQIGLFGTTNISSGRAILLHWGCHADLTGYNLATQNLTTAPITETYHALDGRVDFLTDFDNRDGHELEQTWELAAGGSCSIGPATSYGVHGDGGGLGGGCGGVTCGDVVDAFVCDEQKGRVGRGIRIAAQTAHKTDMEDGACAFFVKGVGTDKDPDNVYNGTTTAIQRQQADAHIVVDGIYVDSVSGHDETNGRGVFLEDVVGTVRLGCVETYGINRGIEIENCVGHFEIDRHSGDGALINNFSKIVKVNECVTDRSNTANAADTENYAPGYESANSRCVEVVGREAALQNSSPSNVTVDGAHAIGEKRIVLDSAINNYAIAVGDTLVIGDNRVTALERAALGAEDIAVSPLLVALSGGETVTLVQEAKTVGNFAFSSSNQGIAVGKHGYLEGDISGVKYTGEHAVRAFENGVVRILGGEMPFVGRSSTALTNRRTIRAEDDSHVVLRDMVARDNPAVTTHLQLVDNATAYVDGCLIEDIASFANAGTSNVAQIAWGKNFNLSGAQISHPSHNANWTPVLERDTTGATGITTTTGYARSIIIGPLVYLDFQITVTAFPATSGTEYMLITGMPVDMIEDAIGDLAIDDGTGTLSLPSNDVFLRADEGTQELRMYRQATGGEGTVMDDEVGNGNIYRGRIWYRWR